MLKHTKWLVLVLFWLFLTPAWADDPKEVMPPFNLETLDGSHLSHKTFLGKVSILTVWASWCRYCYIENKMLIKIGKDYKVPVYGIALKDDPEDTKAWLRRFGNPYVKVGLDPYGIAADALGINGTPESFIIDKKGNIRYRIYGGVDESKWNRTLWPLIQKLQKEKEK